MLIVAPLPTSGGQPVGACDSCVGKEGHLLGVSESAVRSNCPFKPLRFLPIAQLLCAIQLRQFCFPHHVALRARTSACPSRLESGCVRLCGIQRATLHLQHVIAGDLGSANLPPADVMRAGSAGGCAEAQCKFAAQLSTRPNAASGGHQVGSSAWTAACEASDWIGPLCEGEMSRVGKHTTGESSERIKERAFQFCRLCQWPLRTGICVFCCGRGAAFPLLKPIRSVRSCSAFEIWDSILAPHFREATEYALSQSRNHFQAITPAR